MKIDDWRFWNWDSVESDKRYFDHIPTGFAMEVTAEISKGIKVKEHTTLKEIDWGGISRSRMTSRSFEGGENGKVR